MKTKYMALRAKKRSKALFSWKMKQAQVGFIIFVLKSLRTEKRLVPGSARNMAEFNLTQNWELNKSSYKIKYATKHNGRIVRVKCPIRYPMPKYELTVKP